MASGARLGDFRIKVLNQRLAIYRQLGWKREAEQLFDTVSASPEYRRSLLVPDIEMGAEAGYGAEERVADTAGPWGAGLGSSFSRKERGPFGRADIRSSWRITPGKRYLSAGITGSISHRQYHPSGSLHAADSTDIVGSIFTSVVGSSLSSTVALSLNRRIDDSLFVGTSIEGGGIGSSSWMPMLWTGAAAYLSTKGRLNNSRFWVFASVQQTLGRCLQADYQCFANVFFERPSSFGFVLDTSKVLFVEDARRQYPVFYTDDSFTRIIDTSAIRVITGALRNDIIRSGRDSVAYVGLKQPFSGMIINPRVSLILQSKLPVQLGFSWKWHYFWDLYEWDQIAVRAHYLVLSRSDGAYYVIPEDLLMNELTITRGADGGLAIAPAAVEGSPVIHNALRRIDNTISADMSFQVYDGCFGTAALRTFISKTWSTLIKKSPIEIPEWSISASVIWRLKIPNRLIQR